MRKSLLLFATVILVILCLGVPRANAAIGTGVLYIYYDSNYTALVNQNEHGHYEVLPGDTVYIQIAGITEFNLGDPIDVKICWEDHTKTYPTPFTVKILTSGAGSGRRGVGDAADPIEWTVGVFDDGTYPIPVCETMTVHYKSAIKPPGPDYLTVYDADGRMTVAHLHSVPENPLGTLGSISVLLTGLGVYALVRKKKAIPLPKIR